MPIDCDPVQACQNCVHWVAYDQPIETASRGECLCESVLKTVKTYTGSPSAFGVVTPFDWHCKEFLRYPEPQADCDQQGEGV
jgi:hypothetical protein